VVEGGRLVGIVTRGDLRNAGFSGEEVAGPVCASCGSHRHVHMDTRAGGVPFCLECLDRARPPRIGEDLGVGD
jgi:hypothetical protein